MKMDHDNYKTKVEDVYDRRNNEEKKELKKDCKRHE